MLQRIQTIFLLLSAGAMLTASMTPLVIFLQDTNQALFRATGVYLNGALSEASWCLFALGVSSSVMALITIFLYKKRMLQIRFSIFNIAFMVGFYLYFGFIVYSFAVAEGFSFYKIGVGGIMPLIAIIFTIMAIRRIAADEALVHSYNRLR